MDNVKTTQDTAQDVRLDLDRPEEALTEEVLVEEAVIPEVPVDTKLNCPDCNGEGLLTNGNVDPKCSGTGKA